MRVDNPTAMQVIVAWTANKWVVSRNAQEVGSYAYRNHAMDRARQLTAEAQASGADCYMLVKEPDGRWEEKPCPRPRPAAD